MSDLAKLFLPEKGPVPAKRPTLFSAIDNPQGLVEQGNIDLLSRPVVRNPDGSISTVLSMSVNDGGQEVLIPQVSPGGTILTPEGAAALFQATGKHLGKFSNPSLADLYADALHRQQLQFYGDR